MNPVRIDKADLIGGVPIVRVRDALMRSDQFSLARLAALLHVTPEAAQVVLDELVERGYVEPFAGIWQTTIGGNALAGARLGPGVPRGRAQAHLDAFLTRVQEVNVSEHYRRTVEEVILFGSFLDPRIDPVNDVDLAVHLAARGEFDPKAEREHSEAAQAGGRHFNTITDFLGWPEIEVHRHLKSRSRVLAIVDRRDIPPDAPRSCDLPAGDAGPRRPLLRRDGDSGEPHPDHVLTPVSSSYRGSGWWELAWGASHAFSKETTHPCSRRDLRQAVSGGRRSGGTRKSTPLWRMFFGDRPLILAARGPVTP